MASQENESKERFWNGFRSHLQSRDQEMAKHLKKLSSDEGNWYQLKSGIHGLPDRDSHMSVYAGTVQIGNHAPGEDGPNELRVDLVFQTQRVHAIYESLERDRASLNAQLGNGFRLQFIPNKAGKTSRKICIARGANLKDGDWEDHHRWLASGFRSFRKVLVPRVQDLYSAQRNRATGSTTSPDERKEYARILDSFPLDRKLETERKIWARNEQAYLRKRILDGRRNAACAICGKEYPIELLVVAHIKRRADCSPKEKLDFRGNVVPMCRLGCDELFERGFIAVHPDAVVRRTAGRPKTPALTSLLNSLDGLPCDAADERRMAYFTWHRDRTNTP